LPNPTSWEGLKPHLRSPEVVEALATLGEAQALPNSLNPMRLELACGLSPRPSIGQKGRKRKEN